MSKAIISIATSLIQVERIVDRIQKQALVPFANISVIVPDTCEAREIMEKTVSATSPLWTANSESSA